MALCMAVGVIEMCCPGQQTGVCLVCTTMKHWKHNIDYCENASRPTIVLLWRHYKKSPCNLCHISLSSGTQGFTPLLCVGLVLSIIISGSIKVAPSVTSFLPLQWFNNLKTKTTTFIYSTIKVYLFCLYSDRLVKSAGTWVGDRN